MVQVELDWLKKLLEISIDWKFFINLSWQDFPLMSQNQIRNFLTENINNNYLKIANKLLERPKTFTKNDMVFLKIKNNLFARKFDDNVDSDIINNIIINFDLPTNIV